MNKPEYSNFSEKLVDEIIDAATGIGVNLSAVDVTDIAIYTLHSIITSNSGIEKTVTENNIVEILSDDNKLSEYLNITLSGISATNDVIIDEAIERRLKINAVGGGLNGGC